MNAVYAFQFIFFDYLNKQNVNIKLIISQNFKIRDDCCSNFEFAKI